MFGSLFRLIDGFVKWNVFKYCDVNLFGVAFNVDGGGST